MSRCSKYKPYLVLLTCTAIASPDKFLWPNGRMSGKRNLTRRCTSCVDRTGSCSSWVYRGCCHGISRCDHFIPAGRACTVVCFLYTTSQSQTGTGVLSAGEKGWEATAWCLARQSQPTFNVCSATHIVPNCSSTTRFQNFQCQGRLYISFCIQHCSLTAAIPVISGRSARVKPIYHMKKKTHVSVCEHSAWIGASGSSVAKPRQTRGIWGSNNGVSTRLSCSVTSSAASQHNTGRSWDVGA
jgi:hypothetical protein